MSVEYDTSREQLSEILRRDEFQSESWWQNLLERLNQPSAFGEWSFFSWLEPLLSRLFQAGSGSGVGWLLPVLVAGILTLLIWMILRQFYVSRPSPETESAAIASNGQTVKWREQAAVHAARKEYRDGIRCLFRYVLENLDERAIVKRRDHKTNREYREEVAAAAPQLLPVFHALLLRFELVWYGMIHPEASDYEECQRLCRKLTGGEANESR